MDIQLNFINASNNSNNSKVVIFQKNVATDFDERAIAWKVIENCGQGDNHPFTFPVSMYVGASDSWGNYTPQLSTENGQLLALQQTPSGDALSPSGPSTLPTGVQVLNGLPNGAINASIYKNGKLLAIKTSIEPQQTGTFQFEPSIWIGAVSQVDEGELMNSAIVSSINTEIDLQGIASADIVMTGGGTGPDSRPIEFKLENVVMA
ncbi:MAG TPA: hypothetical protein VFF03_08375 [Rhodocyclaceae bacterium]|nr:hypothetical protein [Rhodocyclaceae bacterium]